MLIWRTLFIAFLLFTAFFFARSGSDIVIDTNLRDLSPGSALSKDTQTAIDNLSENIQRRLIFLISGENLEAVKQATNDLETSLDSQKGVTITSAEQTDIQELLNPLVKYRFHLLTEAQQQQLEQANTKKIAQQAQRKIFQLTHSPLLPFDVDPLGWHSDYFSTLLKQMTQDQNTSSKQLDTSSGKETHYQIVQAILDKGAMSYQTQSVLLNQIDELKQQVTSDHKVDIKSSGVFFFAADAAAKSKKDITLISTISTIGVFVLLLVTFRSIGPLLLPFISIVLGVLFAFAVSHFLYAKVHVLTTVFGASLVGIVIDYSIHYFFHHSQANLAHVQDKAAAEKKLHSALLLSLITSLLGYFALYFSDLEALKKVALFSCCGLIMAWLSVICMGSYASKKIVTHDKALSKMLHIFTLPLRLFSVRVTQLTVVLLFIGMAVVLPQLTTDDDPRIFFRPDAKLLANEKAVSQIASDFEPGRYVIIRANSADELYQHSDRFFQQVTQTEGLEEANFRSLTQWLASPREQRKNYQLQKKLYDESGAAAQLYTLLGVKTQSGEKIRDEYQQSANNVLHADTLNQLLNNLLPPLWNKLDSTYVNLVLITKGSDFKALQSLTDAIPHVEYFNTVASATLALKTQRASASQLLLVAYLLIGLLIFFRYRKIQSLKIVLIPLCSTAALILVLHLTGTVFNLFHVMALFLVLGLGMDYGIFAYEMREESVTQQAIFISAITSLLSFGLLALSSIFVAQSFGLILFLGNTFNLISALIYKQHLMKQVSYG